MPELSTLLKQLPFIWDLPISELVVEVISREEAMAFLTKPRSYALQEIWNGSGFAQGTKRKVARHQRGAGGKVDVINYGLRKNGSLVAVARIGMTPYGGAPARAAVGKDNANDCYYLMRQCAIGVTREELIWFVRTYTGRLREDLLARNPERVKKGKKPHNPRYLLSLDDPADRLIDNEVLGVLVDAQHASGKIYCDAGALYGGQTKTRQAALYVDADGKIHSIYRCGKNRLDEARERGVQIIQEGHKYRFIWVLAPEDSREYALWRMALPKWVTTPDWGQNAGLVQPRLLARLLDIIRQINYQEECDYGYHNALSVAV